MKPKIFYSMVLQLFLRQIVQKYTDWLMEIVAMIWRNSISHTKTSTLQKTQLSILLSVLLEILSLTFTLSEWTLFSIWSQFLNQHHITQKQIKMPRKKTKTISYIIFSKLHTITTHMKKMPHFLFTNHVVKQWHQMHSTANTTHSMANILT